MNWFYMSSILSSFFGVCGKVSVECVVWGICGVMEQFWDLFEQCLMLWMGWGDVCIVVFVIFVEQLMYGYQIICVIEECSNGQWKLSFGFVYLIFQLFVDEGFVIVVEVVGKKIYFFIDVGCVVVDVVGGGLVFWEMLGMCGGMNWIVILKVGVQFVQVVVQVVCSGLIE